MAAYAYTTSAATSIRRAMEIFNNTTNELMIQQIITLVLTEFAAIQTAGIGSYEVTDGLEATLLAKVNNMSNNTMKLCMQDFLGYLLAEFALVEANGTGYEYTDTSLVAATGAYGAIDGMRQSFYNWPNSTHRTVFDKIIDVIAVELQVLEDADA